ncbi:MAG: hypothetical protein WCF22_17395 [Candidatus Sulfotelmatobacter sp.]
MTRLGLFPVHLFALVALPLLLSGSAVLAQQERTDSIAHAKLAPLPDLKPDANGKLSEVQMQQLFRVVADKDLENDKLLRNYTYVEREVVTKLDGKGDTKSTEEHTYDILEIYGEQVERLTEKNDKSLAEKEAAKEDAKIQKIIDKRKNESEDERKKREAKEEKEREEDREFVGDVADAYNFTLVGTEKVDGREAWVIDGEPRPGFVPHAKGAKYLPKFHGRVWIDKSDLQLAKLDVECLDTVSWGLFLARFHKGSRFVLEQTRVNNEVWLPRHLAVKVDMRLALLKNFNVNVEQSYRDYKKFRATARIVGVGKVQDN